MIGGHVNELKNVHSWSASYYKLLPKSSYASIVIRRYNFKAGTTIVLDISLAGIVSFLLIRGSQSCT